MNQPTVSVMKPKSYLEVLLSLSPAAPNRSRPDSMTTMKSEGKAGQTCDGAQAHSDTKPQEPNKGPVMEPKSYLAALLSPPPTTSIPSCSRPDSMMMRKGLSGSMQQMDAVQSVQVQSPARKCSMFTLPEDILSDILLWTRPDDQDQSIWLWLCCVSATCKVFRQLVRLEKKGVARLMPTVFRLESDYFYLNGGVSDTYQGIYTSQVSLRVKLMDTIRNSGWMGSHIMSFRAIFCGALNDEGNRFDEAVAMAFKNLLDVRIGFDALGGTPFTLAVDERFLRGVARMHPGLTSLYLMNLGPTWGQLAITPGAFAALSASMGCLQEVGIGVAEYGTNQFPDQHLAAFLSNLNPHLTSLVLDFRDFGEHPGDGGFSNLSACCPNLKSLCIASKKIITSRIAEIIRSKRNLVCIGLKGCEHDANDEGVIDAIVEMQLRLETFQAHYCKWFDDGRLMRLLESQINPFSGQVLLTRLGVTGTSVTPDGMRAFLTRWKETNPVLPLTIESSYHCNESLIVQEEWYRLNVFEFPEVEFAVGSQWYWESWYR